MILPEKGHLLRIFIGESDRHEGLPLYGWILRKARENNLAGPDNLYRYWGHFLKSIVVSVGAASPGSGE
ncbi:MAG: DUF190 domain-containing protein [Fidelibacterota bacterium]